MKSVLILVLLFISLSLEIDLLSTSDSALYLTSYIKRNQTIQGRKLSSVNPKLFLNMESYSGFLTVNEEYNSNLFFWYFPPEPPKNKVGTPWLLWLQGGPGATSMFGLFSEIGPFKYRNNVLEPRLNSWNQEFGLLFIDNPIGAGFSFTNNVNGTPNNLNETSHHLLLALDQFLQVFPELRTAPFYIAGESFAGRYGPDLALKIMNSSLKINLKGLILGNPVINHDDISNYTSMYYQWGMIDSQGVEKSKPFQDAYFKALTAADGPTMRGVLLDKLEDLSVHLNDYNALNDRSPDKSFQDFITTPEIQDALHVGRIKFSFSNQTKLNNEFLTNMVPTVQTLLDHYRILIYCGQLDLVAPCVSGAAARLYWTWHGSDEFVTAERKPWWNGDKLVGYVKSGGDLTEALVRKAGHIAPADQPANMLQLISSYINERPLPSIKSDQPQYVDEVSTTAPCHDGEEKVIVQPSSTGAGFIVSVSLNVFLVISVIAMVGYYWRKKRRNEDFYYTEDLLPEGILTMS